MLLVLMSSNFALLPPAFQDLEDAACKAESHIMGDPRAACFHARFALEAAVQWLYRYDTSLRRPYGFQVRPFAGGAGGAVRVLR